MEAQTAIAVAEGRNYVQLRVQREPDPFFFAIDEAASDSEQLVGEVVDGTGRCLKPHETIKRSKIAKVSRAIMSGGDSPSLIPVNPITPAGGKR